MVRAMFAFFVCAVIAQGCAPASPDVMSEQEKAAVAESVGKRVEWYVAAIRTLDLDRMLQFWADTDGFVFAGDGSLTIGYDAYAAQLRDAIGSTAQVNSIEIRDPQVYVLSRDAAAYSMEFEWSMTSVAGDTTRSRGAWTYVFKRLDGKWKVVHSAGKHLYY
ncbi:MAG: nuclear transport factor 2 family protein [Candidatus Glassbacteria bacterium]|nr:nuclear transport factor 2 family protein [Candidatus Glassbacteria bacterium]